MRLERRPKVLWILLAGLVLWTWGLRWQLPGLERAEFVLPAALKTPEKVNRLVEVRNRAKGAFVNLEASEAHRKAAGEKTETQQRLEKRWLDESEVARVTGRFLVQTGLGDEHRTLLAFSNMNPKALDFNPKSFLYGGPYIYSVASFQAVAALLGWVPLSGGLGYFYANPDAMGRIFLTGRIHQIFATALMVFVLFFVARSEKDEETALWAAAFLAFAPATIYHAHGMKPHQLMTFFWILSAWASVRLARSSGRWRDYLLPALFAGAAAGTSLLGQGSFFVFAGAHIARTWPERGSPSFWTSFFAPRAFVAAAAGIAVFFVLNPYILVSWDIFRYEVLQSTTDQFGFKIDPVAWWNGWSVLLGTGLGMPFLLLATFLSARLAWRGDSGEKVLAWGAGFTFLWTTTMMGAAPAGVAAQSRYLFPEIAVLCWLSAAGMRTLAAPWGKVAASVVLAWNLGSGILMGGMFGQESDSATSNSFGAARWIRKNVPEGERIGVWASNIRPPLPPMRFDHYQVALLPHWTPQEAAEAALPYLVVWKAHGDLLRESEEWASWRPFLERYELAERFGRPVFGRIPFLDPIGNVNMPIEIYRLRTDS